jgi:hypothetical protein
VLRRTWREVTVMSRCLFVPLLALQITTWDGAAKDPAAARQCMEGARRGHLRIAVGASKMRVLNAVLRGLRESERSCICWITSSAGELLLGAEAGHEGVSANYRAVESLVNRTGATVMLYSKGCDAYVETLVGQKFGSLQDLVRFEETFGQPNWVCRARGVFGLALRSLADPFIDGAWYAPDYRVQLYVAADQTDEELTVTVHHEIGHAVLFVGGRRSLDDVYANRYIGGLELEASHNSLRGRQTRK